VPHRRGRRDGASKQSPDSDPSTQSAGRIHVTAGAREKSAQRRNPIPQEGQKGSSSSM